jgi:hypothetical protein
VHLVCFIIRICQDERSRERKIEQSVYVHTLSESAINAYLNNFDLSVLRLKMLNLYCETET